MTSLTQTAITTRKIIRYGIFFVIFLIIGRIVLNIGISIYKKLFPAPPPAPTVTWGKLPKLPFTESAKTNLSFTLETTEGSLPTLPEQGKVFFMTKLASNLLSLDTAKEKANQLGFSPVGEEVSQYLYRFKHKTAPATLEMNIITGIFSISYNLKEDASPIEVRPPVPEVAASEARSFLSGASILPNDLTGPTESNYLKLEGDQFVSALSLSDANLIRINLFRKSYDNLPSLTPKTGQANVWFTVSGSSNREKKIIAGEFHYFPVDESQFSTYPLITAQQAWDTLTQGKAYIASIGNNKEGDNIKIRKVYLAYFDPGVSVDFFQPIVVLEGDKNFVAYVPAITSDYYGE
jgi:hypothetical protein